MKIKTVDERYHNDVQFRMLVDVIFDAIGNLHLTPSETREAAMLAQIKYEMLNPRPILMSNDLLLQLQYLMPREFKE